jgi:hypothetical protein
VSPAQPSDETGKTDGLAGGKGIAKVAEAVALRERTVGQRIATRGFVGLQGKGQVRPPVRPARAKKALAVTKVPLVTLAQQSN